MSFLDKEKIYEYSTLFHSILEWRYIAMPWFNVDDGFYDHPKINAASNAGIGLWVKAGSWCAKHLTDGFIPVHQVKRLGGTPTQVSSLVDAGLWIVHVGAGGKVEKYEISGYLEANRSRNRVEIERKENQARQQKHRAKQRSTSVNANSSPRDNGVSHSA
ncbi:MAG: hypothetical protein Q4F10_02790, partial [Corynebacterium glutamicum]|nr:hypothetical protein [Corynebacterium glutamicum]